MFNPNNAVTQVVERLRLRDGSEVVRKVMCRVRPAPVAHWAAGVDPGHWNYWRREVEAYDAVATASFAGEGLRAPELVGRTTPGPGIEVLFLRFHEGRTGAEVSTDDLCAVAGALGRGQGGADAITDVPSWWSGDWIWRYALSRPPGSAGYHDHPAWEHPMVVEGFGEHRDPIRTGFAQLYDDVDEWRTLLARLPSSFAHLDCWANNLLVVDGAAPVAIDWSFCGLGAVGEDPSNLVLAGLLDHYAPPTQFRQIDDEVFTAYSAGLAAADWPHPIEVARIGMCAAAMKFVWLPAAMVANADHRGPTGYGGEVGLDHLEVFRRRAQVFVMMLDRFDEARHLAAELGWSW